MKQIMKWSLTAMLFIGLASMVAAQRGQREFDPETQAKNAAQSLQKEIGISDAKTNQVELVFLKYQSIMKEKRDKMWGQRDELRGDQEKMMAMRDEMRKEMEQMRDQRDEEIKGILSKKEFKKFLAWDEKRMERARDRIGGQRNGRGPGPGPGQAPNNGN